MFFIVLPIYCIFSGTQYALLWRDRAQFSYTASVKSPKGKLLPVLSNILWNDLFRLALHKNLNQWKIILEVKF